MKKRVIRSSVMVIGPPRSIWFLKIGTTLPFDPSTLPNRTATNFVLEYSFSFSGKGVDIAVQATERIGAKLIIAGQNPENREFPPHVEFVGYADVEKRKHLMSRAKASFVASTYLEPFGGVQVENLISGTPTITTDWGAFVENNPHGVTGYRCRTFSDFVEAAKNIDKIDPSVCRKFGEQFSLDNVAPRYEKFFQDVLNVYTGEGWYEMESVTPFL